MTIQDFIAGWASGGTGIVFGHPLDTVKARLQTSNNYKGIVDCLVRTVKNEGVFGLYKGMAFPFLSAGCLHSLLFAGYGTALQLMHPQELNVTERKDLPFREILLASMFGTLLQLVPAIPIELVKTKLQVQQDNYSTVRSTKAYKGPIDCTKRIIAKSGFSGMYKGGTVMFCRDNIGYLFYLPVYETVKKTLNNQGANAMLSQMIAGGCAGASGWLVICPIEVVKNRLQTINEGSSPVAIAKEVWREGGPRTFFKGGLTMVLRGFPANAIIFVVYEHTLWQLQNRKVFE